MDYLHSVGGNDVAIYIGKDSFDLLRFDSALN